MPHSDLLTELLKSVWRQRRVAALVMALGLAIPVAILLNVEPRYEATALVHVARMSGQDVAGGRVFSSEGDPVAIRTEVEILSSDAISRKVIDELDLAATPEFQLGADTGFSVGGFVRGLVGVFRATPEGAETAEAEADRVLGVYRNRLSVVNDERSAIAAISFNSANPVMARDIANAHARAYLASRASRRLEATEVSESRIVSPASLPSTPTSRQTSLLVLMGLALAFGLGVATAILVDILTKKPSGLTSLSGMLKVRPLVSLPFDPRMKAPEQPPATGIFSERVRTLASLVLDEYPAGGASFLVVSALPDEGASHVAVWLAKALVAKGTTVGLIEGDLRTPSLARILKVPKVAGLAEWLKGTTQLGEVEQATKGAFLLHAGLDSPSAVDHLTTEKAAGLVAHVRSRYAVTLVTAPPLLPAAEGVLFASSCQAVIFVARSPHTNLEFYERALDLLRAAGTPVMGLVLTGPDADDEAMLKNRALSDYYRSQSLSIGTTAFPPARLPSEFTSQPPQSRPSSMVGDPGSDTPNHQSTADILTHEATR